MGWLPAPVSLKSAKTAWVVVRLKIAQVATGLGQRDCWTATLTTFVMDGSSPSLFAIHKWLTPLKKDRSLLSLHPCAPREQILATTSSPSALLMRK
jgi:hypothetical protein